MEATCKTTTSSSHLSIYGQKQHVELETWSVTILLISFITLVNLPPEQQIIDHQCFQYLNLLLDMPAGLVQLFRFKVGTDAEGVSDTLFLCIT